MKLRDFDGKLHEVLTTDDISFENLFVGPSQCPVQGPDAGDEGTALAVFMADAGPSFQKILGNTCPDKSTSV